MARKKFGDGEKDRARRRCRRNGNACELGRLLDIFPALWGEEKLEPLRGAINPNRDEDFARDRYGFFQQKRRIGIVERRQDQPPCVAKLGKLDELPDQPALAAAAFEDLRLEHKTRPDRHVIGRILAGAEQHAARHGNSVPSQQGFSVYLGKTHNGSASAVRRGSFRSTMACRAN
jgi:hypothetical protein